MNDELVICDFVKECRPDNCQHSKPHKPITQPMHHSKDLLPCTVSFCFRLDNPNHKCIPLPKRKRVNPYDRLKRT